MYSGSGYSDWEIGDITVIIHRGVYHLFHLIIPNHDYIAHAVSRDGISWKRVNNALFVGHPDNWDDDMLWTMHVCERDNQFLMYYTGLQRKDRGVVSRIGVAASKNLIDWEKLQLTDFPIAPKEPYYETEEHNPRKWLSFRDPFYYKHENKDYLLICARSNQGPVSRRGCVGLVDITNTDIQFLPPLLYPMVYDDIECPCVFQLGEHHYLIGSIREDVKVRYWFAPDFLGEYHSFHADVLLPQGNYAARTIQDGNHLLIYNFFYAYGKIDALRVLPPPKELDFDSKGRLLLRSFYRWKLMKKSTIEQRAFGELKLVLANQTAYVALEEDKWVFGARSGYEIFCFPKPSAAFVWEGLLTVEGMGKLGLVTDIDTDGNGYFISFDVSNGLVEIRSWGFNPLNNKQNFIFNSIQSNTFEVNAEKSFRFKLIRYGHYIELAIDDVVKLTLMDYTYSGGFIGLYSASSIISLQHSTIDLLPDQEEEYASQQEAQSILMIKESFNEDPTQLP